MTTGSRIDRPLDRARGLRAAVPRVEAGGATFLPARARALAQSVWQEWALTAVLASYLLAACVVPTLTPVALGDDWVYTRSVEILIQRGELRILDPTVVPLVFQVLWGGLFATLFGLSFGALRLSTVTLMGLSGGALYALCRELGVGRERSALGAAVYLFNPLGFVLGFTFMSDPQLTALLVVATLCYTRGLRPAAPSSAAIVLGSLFAAAAFLVRQQGALLPAAVLCYLIATRRLAPDRMGLRRAAQVAALPVATAAAYYLWLRFLHGVPKAQLLFLNDAVEAGWDGAARLAGQLVFYEAMYAGLFVLPMAAALRDPRQLLRLPSRSGRALFAAWAALVLGGVVVAAMQHRFMPYVEMFLNRSGLGSTDLRGGRPWLVDGAGLQGLTAACALASLVFALALGRKLGVAFASHRAGAGLVAMIAIWQGLGVLAPSVHFVEWPGSMDRYLLPLLPFAVALALWATRDLRLALPAAWLITAGLAAFSIAGTRDYLVFQQATWEFARWANAHGIPNERLDAGAAWDAYHLYREWRPNRPWRDPETPWWIDLFTPQLEADFVISGWPLRGYDPIARLEYSAWLYPEPPYLYLLHRRHERGPP